MPIHLTWQMIAVRLILTFLCSGILGLDRDEKGRSAGLRTNLLVGLAACLAMLQANLLNSTTGKPPDSFVVMDTMRFPLGILSGIGFIGGGAILKRGELAVGVTTAATIWFVTVMGLCFGGGQLAIGLAGFALGFVTLTVLRKAENHLPRRHYGVLHVAVSPEGPSQNDIATLLNRGGVSVRDPSISVNGPDDVRRSFGWKVDWKGQHTDNNIPGAIDALSSLPGIEELRLTRSN